MNHTQGGHRGSRFVAIRDLAKCGSKPFGRTPGNAFSVPG